MMKPPYMFSFIASFQNMIQKVEEVEDVAGNVAAISEEQAAF